ncbi:MAG TPA: hypothetical protein VI318_17950 [Baekduia sp.]
MLLEVGGAPPRTSLTWRARIRDDDGFVWRAQGDAPVALSWTPAKPSAGAVAALRSLRPVVLEVRVEDPDGAASSRTLTRSFLADGVKVRRWREGTAGTLYLPAGRAEAALVVDPSGDAADVAPMAAALLASRGALVFVATAGGTGDPADVLRPLPDPPHNVRRLAALPLPPGVPARADADGAAWDELLSDLGAIPRRVAR